MDAILHFIAFLSPWAFGTLVLVAIAANALSRLGYQWAERIRSYLAND